MSDNNDKKISQLPVASSLTGAEVVPVIQAGANKKTTTADIANLAGGGGGGGVNSVNGDTGPAVVLDATEIQAAVMPANYSPGSGTIQDALIGIDNALGSVSGAVSSVNGQTGDVVLTKSDVGLSNTDNTSDANKPVSSATQAALDLKANTLALATVALTGVYSDLSGKPTLSAVATSGDYNDLSGTPTLGSSASHPATDFATAAQGALADTALQAGDNISTLVNDAGYLTSASEHAGYAHVIEVDNIRGDDGTGDGTLSTPYLTLTKAMQVLPDALDGITQWAIRLSPGSHSVNTLSLKQNTHIFGAGSETTSLNVISNVIDLDLTNDNHTSANSLVSFTGITFVDATGFGIDTSTISSSFFLKVSLKDVNPDGSNIFIGKAAGNDILEVQDCNWLGDCSPTRFLLEFKNSKFEQNISMTCSAFSGGGEFVARFTGIYVVQNIGVDSDNDKDQTVYITGSRVTSLSANGTNSRFIIDSSSLYNLDSVALTNGSTIVYADKAGSIDPSYPSPVNYTPSAQDVGSYLEAIDNALTPLATIAPTNGKVAMFDESDGHLKATILGLTTDQGLDFNKSETITNPPDPIFRPIFRTEYNLESSEATFNDAVVLNQCNVNLDRNNLGYNYGDLSEGNSSFGLNTTYLSHGGEGFVRRIDVDNLFVELGREDTTPAGSVDWISLKTDSLVLRPNYDANFIRVKFAGLELRGGNTVSDVRIFEINNQVRGNSNVTGFYGGQSITVNVEDTATIQNNEILSLRLNVSPGASAEYSALLNANINNEGSIRGGQFSNIYINNQATGTFQEFFTGLNVSIQNDGVALNGASGLNVNFSGSGTYGQSPTGVNVNMGNFVSGQRRSSFSGQGLFQNQNEVETASSMMFDQANGIFTLFRVADGTPITGTAFLANNFTTGFLFNDDMDQGLIGIGATSVATTAQLSITSGKTVEAVNVNLSGVSYPGLPGAGGTLQKLNIYSAYGIINLGGPEDAVVNEVRCFTMPSNGSLGVQKWGVDIEDPAAENHFAKSIIIGTANLVTNDSIALELSDKKALRLIPMTFTEMMALDAVEGMIICVNDDVDTRIYSFTGGVWNPLPRKVSMPSATTDPGSIGDYAVDTNYLANWVAGIGWVRVPVSTW